MIKLFINFQQSLMLIYQLMSEEKIRNYKQVGDQGSGTESIPSFLLKTYQILENHKYSDIICWTKNGQGFVVKRVKQFAENILPTHFRHSNYTSFVRQLNMYDFHKTRQQNQQNAFKNSMFRRGQRHLLKEIQRKDYKKKKEKPENYQKARNPVQTNSQGEQSGYNRTDKKIEKIKEQHKKILEGFSSLFQEVQKQQTKLASFDDYCDISSQLGICTVVDSLFNCKNSNNLMWTKICQLNMEWDSLISSKQKSIKAELASSANLELNYDNQMIKKEQDGTFQTLQSFNFKQGVNESNL